MLKQLSKKVADYLGLDEIPIEFGKIEDDSILITKGIPKIVINEKYNGNYLECAKSITHEYRHAFQIMMIRFYKKVNKNLYGWQKFVNCTGFLFFEKVI